MIATAEAVFAVNDSYECGSGSNPLLDAVFDNDREAYETTEAFVDILGGGYVAGADAYARTYFANEGVYIEDGEELPDCVGDMADDAESVRSEGGSASKEGDFSNLYGSTVDEILDRIPDEATLRELHPVAGGSTEGFEFKWTQDGQTYRVRVHNADPGAPSGSNAANGWIVRVQRGRQYYDYTINDFQPARYTNPNGDFFDENIMNNKHIPIKNPYEP